MTVNSFCPPLKPVAYVCIFYCNVFKCVLEFHFCLDLKSHCLHFTTILTFLWNLWNLKPLITPEFLWFCPGICDQDVIELFAKRWNNAPNVPQISKRRQNHKVLVLPGFLHGFCLDFYKNEPGWRISNTGVVVVVVIVVAGFAPLHRCTWLRSWRWQKPLLLAMFWKIPFLDQNLPTQLWQNCNSKCHFCFVSLSRLVKIN